MKAAKRKNLERAGWRVGDVESFLGLSREEANVVERRLAAGRKRLSPDSESSGDNEDRKI